MARALIIFFICINSILSSDKIEQIDLITTNDMHGSIGKQDAFFMNPKFPPLVIGGAGYYKYIKQNISDSASIILDGGNFFQGHPISLIDSGRTVIEFMNKVGYTALVPGVDDFVFGAKNLNNLSEISDFPFLAANINCNNCDLVSENIKPYIIKRIKGINIGILGIVNSELEDMVLSHHINGISIRDIKESLDYWVPIVNQLSDVLIILTSSGVPWDREEKYNTYIESVIDGSSDTDKKLNAIEMGLYSDGVDFIVSGGFSKGYRIPWKDPNTGTYITQNYGNGTSFGHLLLKIHEKNFIGYDFTVKNSVSQTLLLDDFYPDIEMMNWIDEKYAYASTLLYDVFNTSSYTINNQVNKKVKSSIDDIWNFPILGRDDKLDIMTWNCEFFPIAGDSTIRALSEAITDFDIDIIAFQEIKKIAWFGKLMENLPDYAYSISDHSSFMSQAIIYKNDKFDIVRKVEPFADNDYNFAGRPPLRVDLYSYDDSTFYSVINIHMKCCDSGLERRKNASMMLYDYLRSDIESGYSNLIILGDWNDDLKDNEMEHCFKPFFDDKTFYFVNQRIVDDPSQASYPKKPYFSFLDHILVTQSLVDQKSNFNVETIDMGSYMGGYEEYEKLISDHLPVLFSF